MGSSTYQQDQCQRHDLRGLGRRITTQALYGKRPVDPTSCRDTKAREVEAQTRCVTLSWGPSSMRVEPKGVQVDSYPSPCNLSVQVGGKANVDESVVTLDAVGPMGGASQDTRSTSPANDHHDASMARSGLPLPARHYADTSKSRRIAGL